MFFVVPALSRDPYAAAIVLRDTNRWLSRNNPGLWLWIPAQGRDDSLSCGDVVAEPVIGRRFAPTRWLANDGVIGDITPDVIDEGW